MATKGAEVLDPAALKAQHAVVYDANTSPIKDDIVALVAVLKSGTGQLTRQEAGFLAWYHAMDGYDRQSELVATGAINICLGLLDASAVDVPPPDKTCAAGILVGLCDEEEMREAVVRGKGAGNAAVTVLHALIHDHRDAMQLYATRILRLCAEEPTARSVLLRSMEGTLQYVQLYRETIQDCHNSHVVAQLANFLCAVIDKRDDLRGEAIDNRLVEATLESLQKHKMDSAAGGLLRLLLLLLEDKAAWARVHDNDGLNLLVDFLGPPPKTLMDQELAQYRAVLDPGWADTQDKARMEAARQEDDVKKASEGPESPLRDKESKIGALPSRRAASGSPTKASKGGPNIDSLTTQLGQEGQVGDESSPFASAIATTGNLSATAAAATTTSQPSVDKRTLLSHNRAGLKWKAIVSLNTHSLAAGCLYTLCQNTDYMHKVSSRCAASRLAPLLLKVMEAEDGGKKKGGKKKGLSLSPEQTQMLVHITGCLKFLSLVNVNRYRIAALGTVKALTSLYTDCPHTLLRRNAHVVLSNMALLAENGQVLLDGGLPEEFLVPRPLRLSPAEREELLAEFPDATIVTPPLPGLTQTPDKPSTSPLNINKALVEAAVKLL